MGSIRIYSHLLKMIYEIYNQLHIPDELVHVVVQHVPFMQGLESGPIRNAERR